MKLTDTQLVILSAAAQREDRAITIPDRLKGVAAEKVANKLIGNGLAEEVATSGDRPVWRRGKDNARMSLVITDAGFQALGIDPPKLDAEDDEAAGAGSRNQPSAARRGRNAQSKARDKVRSQRPKQAGAEADLAVDPARSMSAGAPRAGSKMAQLIGLLQRPKGAGIDTIVATLDWLPHTSRAALTGLRKRGFDIERRRSADAKTTYHITSEPPALGADASPARRGGRSKAGA